MGLLTVQQVMDLFDLTFPDGGERQGGPGGKGVRDATPGDIERISRMFRLM